MIDSLFKPYEDCLITNDDLYRRVNKYVDEHKNYIDFLCYVETKKVTLKWTIGRQNYYKDFNASAFTHCFFLEYIEKMVEAFNKDYFFNKRFPLEFKSYFGDSIITIYIKDGEIYLYENYKDKIFNFCFKNNYKVVIKVLLFIACKYEHINNLKRINPEFKKLLEPNMVLELERLENQGYDGDLLVFFLRKKVKI